MRKNVFFENCKKAQTIYNIYVFKKIPSKDLPCPQDSLDHRSRGKAPDLGFVLSLWSQCFRLFSLSLSLAQSKLEWLSSSKARS